MTLWLWKRVLKLIRSSNMVEFGCVFPLPLSQVSVEQIDMKGRNIWLGMLDSVLLKFLGWPIKTLWWGKRVLKRNWSSETWKYCLISMCFPSPFPISWLGMMDSVLMNYLIHQKWHFDWWVASWCVIELHRTDNKGELRIVSPPLFLGPVYSESTRMTETAMLAWCIRFFRTIRSTLNDTLIGGNASWSVSHHQIREECLNFDVFPLLSLSVQCRANRIEKLTRYDPLWINNKNRITWF